MLVKMGSSSPGRDENKKSLKPPPSNPIALRFPLLRSAFGICFHGLREGSWSTMALKHTFGNIPWGVHHGILSLGVTRNALLRFVKQVCTEKAKQESMSFQHQMWTTVINKPLVSQKLW